MVDQLVEFALLFATYAGDAFCLLLVMLHEFLLITKWGYCVGLDLFAFSLELAQELGHLVEDCDLAAILAR